MLRHVRAIAIHLPLVHLPLNSSPNVTSSTSTIPNAATAKKRPEAILSAKKWDSPPFTAKLKDGVWTVIGRWCARNSYLGAVVPVTEEQESAFVKAMGPFLRCLPRKGIFNWRSH